MTQNYLSPLAGDAHLREECIESEQVYQGHFLDVRRDHVRLPDGTTAQREYIRHPGAAVIVPMLDDGRLVLERQFRYPLQRVMLEFPAGKLDMGEASQACAERELAEETGYRASEWAFAGIMHNAIAYSDEGIEIWFARGLVMGERKLDQGEFLDLVLLSPAELSALVMHGELTDAKTMTCMLWLDRLLSGVWTASWQGSLLAIPDSA